MQEILENRISEDNYYEFQFKYYGAKTIDNEILKNYTH